MIRYSWFFVLLLLTWQSTAQTDSSSSAAKHKALYRELAKVPGKDVARPNPLSSDPEAAVAGEKLFGMHCAECHGATANGTRRAPSLRVDPIQHASPGALFWVLTNGAVRRGMPVWSKLPEPQRWQLVSYIKSLSLPQSE